MGLDLVELVLEVEDEFDIYLPDKDVECLATPNDLATYIFDKYQKKDDNKCGSQVAFYKLRKLFIDNFGNKREELVPSADLETLLGDNIRSKWKRLNSILDNRLMGTLVLNKKENLLLFYFGIGVFILYYYLSRDLLDSIWLSLLTYLFFLFSSNIFFGKEIPKRYTKFSALIKYMEDNTIQSMYNSKEKVLKRVIEISSIQLDIPIDKIKPDSKYVEDLGAG